jgi:hypothetical protein
MLNLFVMKPGFISVPFKMESAHGMNSIEGLAKFSPAGIVLEFEAKLFGVMRQGIKEARIPVADIMDLKFKKGLAKFGAKIQIRPNSFAALGDLPYENGRVTLKISREDHERAARAVEQLNAILNGAANQPEKILRPLFDEDGNQTKELAD